MMNRWTKHLLWLAAVTVGCEPLHTAERAAIAAERQPVHVDSTFSIDEEIRRFRAALPDSVAALRDGATTRDELVATFLAALETQDHPTLESIAIDIVEFAFLYYPHTRYTSRPYELSPAIVWFQSQNYGSKGLNRALGRYGGKPIGALGYVCPAAPTIEGPNTIHARCIVRREDEAGETTELPILGAILERDGRFKFLNYANGL